MSDSEPKSDFEIRSNDSVVFSGLVRYNGIEDDWHSLYLKSSAITQKISIIHKSSGIRLDTLVTGSGTLTHIFLTYSYHQLKNEELVRFKKNAHNPEEENFMRSMFAQPRHFSVLIMSGQISIP